MKTAELILITVLIGTSVFAQGTGDSVTVLQNAPNPGYSIQIQSVYQKCDVTYVHAHIMQPDPDMNYASVITPIKDSTDLPKMTKIVRVYITGKNWNWSDKNDYIYIEDKKEFEEITKGLKQIKSSQQ